MELDFPLAMVSAIYAFLQRLHGMAHPPASHYAASGAPPLPVPLHGPSIAPSPPRPPAPAPAGLWQVGGRLSGHSIACYLTQ